MVAFHGGRTLNPEVCTLKDWAQNECSCVVVHLTHNARPAHGQHTTRASDRVGAEVIAATHVHLRLAVAPELRLHALWRRTAGTDTSVRLDSPKRAGALM